MKPRWTILVPKSIALLADQLTPTKASTASINSKSKTNKSMFSSAIAKTSPKSSPKRLGMGRNSPASPKGLHVEVGGAKAGSRVSAIPGCKCVDVRALPNPYAHVAKGKLRDDPDSIDTWLVSRQKAAFDGFVNEVLQQLLKQRCVRVQCHGGKHRSAAVAKVAMTMYNIMRTDCMSRGKVVKLDA